MGNLKLFIIVCLAILSTACSNSPKVMSASEDQVIVKGEPEDFVDAHYKARKLCQENARITEYNADYSEDLETTAFNCIEIVTEEEIVEAEEETPTEESEEIPTEEELPEENIEEPLAENPSQEN